MAGATAATEPPTTVLLLLHTTVAVPEAEGVEVAANSVMATLLASPFWSRLIMKALEPPAPPAAGSRLRIFLVVW